MGNEESAPAEGGENKEDGGDAPKSDEGLLKQFEGVAHTVKKDADGNIIEDEKDDPHAHVDVPQSYRNWILLKTPPEDAEYRFRYQIARVESMLFYVKAGGNARVGLARKPQLGKEMFEIVMDNGSSFIQRVKVGDENGTVLATAETPEMLSAEEAKPFWVKWSDQQISFGRGSKVGEEELLSWQASEDGEVLVLHVGTWTPQGVSGDWFLSPDTFTATVIARSIKAMADSDDTEPSMKASPYLANWFCFKPDAVSPYQKHHHIVREKGPVVVGEDGKLSFSATWVEKSTDQKREFLRETVNTNAKRLDSLYKKMTQKQPADPAAS